MKSLEEVLKKLEYLTTEDVENPKWELEELVKFNQHLTDNDFLTYVVYLSLRPDLSDDDKDTCNKIIKIKRALEKRDVEKQFKHFDEIKSSGASQ